MKYEIQQEKLQIAINLISALANTNVFTPARYSEDIVPFLEHLQSLPIIDEKEDNGTECEVEGVENQGV